MSGRKSSRAVWLICFLMVIALTISSCNAFVKPNATTISSTPAVTTSLNTAITTESGALFITGTPVKKPSVFDRDVAYLQSKGIRLPNLTASSILGIESFFELMVEAYESFGAEIDTSKFNPATKASVALKKLTLIETFTPYHAEEDFTSTELSYTTAANFLMNFQDSIQRRLFWNDCQKATAIDLLRRLNTSIALYSWQMNLEQTKAFSLSDLLPEEANPVPDQTLTRAMIAQMLVTAYEELVGEIKAADTPKLTDTVDVYASKANQFFIWPYTEKFEPEKTGSWDDWNFISAMTFDWQLNSGLKLEESKVQFGAIVAALSAIIRGYEQTEPVFADEKIVLNERTYAWYVSQKSTGKYSDVNCMPACVVMSMLYQNIKDVPTVESLREMYPSNGSGWFDGTAATVMENYNLKFTDSWDFSLDKMLTLLDEGNVLFTMYLLADLQQGHAVIIKGYWQLGNSLKFIVSDPNYDQSGQFGYPEYTTDALKLIKQMQLHTPRFLVVSGEKADKKPA